MIRKKKPWNKNRVVGQKVALNYDQVQAIRTILVSGIARDRALFALAIDSSLREGDLLNLRVRDVKNSEGVIKNVITVLPSKTRKTGLTVSFEPTDYTRTQLQELIEGEKLIGKPFSFTAEELTQCAYFDLRVTRDGKHPRERLFGFFRIV